MGGLRLLSGAEGNKPPGKRDRMEGGCRGKWVWTSQTERILFTVTELGSVLPMEVCPEPGVSLLVIEDGGEGERVGVKGLPCH